MTRPEAVVRHIGEDTMSVAQEFQQSAKMTTKKF